MITVVRVCGTYDKTTVREANRPGFRAVSFVFSISAFNTLLNVAKTNFSEPSPYNRTGQLSAGRLRFAEMKSDDAKCRAVIGAGCRVVRNGVSIESTCRLPLQRSYQMDPHQSLPQ